MASGTIKGISWWIWLCAAALSVIFAYAGILKILDPTGLKISIDAYKLVPEWVSWLGAYYLPWVEVFCAVGLWIKPLRTAAAGLIIGMMAVFIVAIAQAWARGLNFECGCFGDAFELSDPRLMLLRDGIFLIMAFLVFWAFSRKNRC